MLYKLYPWVWPRIYAFLRTRILSLKKIEKHVPEGRILDVGCGYGISSVYFARNKNRTVTGNELIKKRVKIAKKAGKRISNVEFEAGSLIKSRKKFDGIVAIDLMHHINNREKEEFVRQARKRLKKNGKLIIKDIDKKPFHKYLWNYVHDILMSREKLYFYSANQFIRLLEKNNFNIKKIKKIKSFFYPHVLLVAE